MTKRSPPVVIPPFFATDRATRRLVTAWCIHSSRYALCCKRVHWNTAAARDIEKKRRKEKWQRLAKILDIERTLLHWLAKETRHPDIWSSRLADGPVSRLRQLEKLYLTNCRLSYHAKPTERKDILLRREKIVAEKRAIERRWMLALLHKIDPKASVPAAPVLHPRELLPRKLARASKELSAELTT